MNKSINIKIDSVLIFLLFFSLFKVAIIPDILRQCFKLCSVIIIFIFVISKVSIKKLINISLLYSFSIIISAFINYFGAKITFWSVLESFLNALLFYDLYSLIMYFYLSNKFRLCLKTFYNICLVSCIFNVITIIILGCNDIEQTYFFGNKFSSSYILILFIALFGAVHNMFIKKNQLKLFLLFTLSLALVLYMRSITAFISLVVILPVFLMFKKIPSIIINSKTVTIALLASVSIIFIFDYLLQVDYINHLVFTIFGKSISIYGRQEIYNVYLKALANDSIIFGHGYNNRLLYMMSNGTFGNAQNGLFEQFISYGLFGVFSIVFITYYCFRNSPSSHITFYLSLVVYAMIIAATVEVTINWFFFLGIILVYFSDLSYLLNKKDNM